MPAPRTLLPSLLVCLAPLARATPQDPGELDDLPDWALALDESEPALESAEPEQLQAAARATLRLLDGLEAERVRLLGGLEGLRDHAGVITFVPRETPVAEVPTPPGYGESLYTETKCASLLAVTRHVLRGTPDPLPGRRAELGRIVAGELRQPDGLPHALDEAELRLRAAAECVAVAGEVARHRISWIAQTGELRARLALATHGDVLGGLHGHYRESVDARLKEAREETSVSEDDEHALGLALRPRYAEPEGASLATTRAALEKVAAQVAADSERLGTDLGSWLAALPPTWRPGAADSWVLEPLAVALAVPAPSPGYTLPDGWALDVWYHAPPAGGARVADGRDLVSDPRDPLYSLALEPQLSWPTLDTIVARTPRAVATNSAGPPRYPDLFFVPLPRVFATVPFGPGVPGVGSPWDDPLVPDVDGVTPRTLGGMLPEEVADATDGDHVVLVVRGRNLADNAGQVGAVSSDGEGEYEQLLETRLDWDALTAEGHPWRGLFLAYRARLRQWGFDAQALAKIDGQDVAVLRYRLPPGSPARTYEYKVWLAEGRWFHPGNGLADLSFVRDLGDGQVETLDYLLIHDKVRVEVRLAHAIPGLDSLDVALAYEGEIVSDEAVGTFHAFQDANDPCVYRTNRLHLKHPRESSHTGRGEIAVSFGAGGRALARVAPDQPARTRRLAGAQVIAAPEAVGAHWRWALWRAARALDKPVDGDWRRISGERAAVLEAESFFLGGVHHELELDVGDLAAMLLLRDTFVRDTQPILEKLETLHRDSAANPLLLRGFRDAVEHAVRHPEHPLGALEVTGTLGRWESERREESFAFRNVFDAGWRLDNAPRGRARRGWMDGVTRQALGLYVDSVRKSIAQARDVQDDDVAGLLALTGHGFEPVVRRLLPRMVDLEEQTWRDARGRPEPGFVWKVNRIARARVNGIATLGAAQRANEEHAGVATDVQMAVLSLGMFAPATVGLRLLSVWIGANLLAAELIDKAPAWHERKKEVEFAVGASAILGTERARLARLREIPTWAMTVGVVGGMLGLGGDLPRLVSTVRTTRGVAQAEKLLSAVESGGHVALLSSKLPSSAETLALLTRAKAAQLAGARLSALERRAASLFDRLNKELSTPVGSWPRGELPVPLKAVPHPQDASKAADVVLGPDGAYVALHRARVARSEPVSSGLATRAPPGALGVTGDAVPAAIAEYARSVGVELSHRLGQPGAFAEVFAIRGQPDRVFKVYRAGDKGRAAAQRAKDYSDLLKGKVAQFEVLEVNIDARRPFLIQETVPSAVIHTGEVRAATVVDPAGKEVAWTRVSGLTSLGGQRLPKKQAVALCELYQDMARKGIVWCDGHIRNVAFVEEGGRTVAKVLDQDYLWKWNAIWSEGHNAESMMLPMCYRFPGAGNSRMYSMAGQKITDEADALFTQGRHMWSDPELFMMKQLERHGFVHFDRVKKEYVSGLMDVDHARSVFKDLTDPRWIDPDLSVLVRERAAQVRAAAQLGG